MDLPIRHHVPLLGPAVSMIAGIFVMTYSPLTWPVLPLLAVCIVVTCLFSRWPLTQTALLKVDFLLVGMALVQCQPPPVSAFQTSEAVVVSEPVEKPKTIAVDLLLPQSGQRLRR